ncbi:MAG: hypothetical protein Q4A11_05120 [Brachymonas sp.]|nr:hypothetical protein [Brachymonas sp.]
MKIHFNQFSKNQSKETSSAKAIFQGLIQKTNKPYFGFSATAQQEKYTHRIKQKTSQARFKQKQVRITLQGQRDRHLQARAVLANSLSRARTASPPTH